MSQARIFELGPDLGWRNLGFPDLEIRFKNHLGQARSITDLDRLIESINPLFQEKHYLSEDLLHLKKLRQKAYDRKRVSKFQIPRSNPDPGAQISMLPENLGPDLGDQIHKSPKQVPDLGIHTPKPKTKRDVVTNTESQKKGKNMDVIIPLPNEKTESFAQGAQRALCSINGEQFVKTAPKALAWLVAATTVSFFLWRQSLALYETAGFIDAIYSAAGGILMITGFAAYHSITRSWLALFFCLYAGAYEGYLIVSGTIHDDKQTAMAAVETDRELVFLQQKADKEHEKYAELKQRYEDPESKVYKNEWFSKTHLNPAWDATSRANQELILKRAALTTLDNVEHVTWLKIFYRLGLVFLCMVCVHQLFHSCITRRILRG